jgi:hypothetical protein
MTNKKTQAKSNRPTSLLFLFFGRSAMRVGCGHACHRLWSTAAGCVVFLFELVPSDDPFIWRLCDPIFLFSFFQWALLLFFPEQ